jgi:hypothetical protein
MDSMDKEDLEDAAALKKKTEVHTKALDDFQASFPDIEKWLKDYHKGNFFSI